MKKTNIKRKKVAYIIGAWIVAFLLLFSFACSRVGTGMRDLRFSLDVSGTVEVERGESLDINLTRGLDITGTLEWISSNPSVATVDELTPTIGRVTALTNGFTTITARVGVVTASVEVEVVDPEEYRNGTDPIDPQNINLDIIVLEMLVDEVHNLTNNITTELTGLVFSVTAGQSAVTVNPISGIIHAVAVTEGLVTVTVSATRGDGTLAMAMLTVIVHEPLVDIVNEDRTLVFTEELQLSVNHSPQSRQLTFTSSNEEVATVSPTGLITAGTSVSAPNNTTIITARLTPTIFDTITITVVEQQTRVELIPEAGTISIGQGILIHSFVRVVDASNWQTGGTQQPTTRLTFESSDSEIAQVNAETGFVRGVASGSATITATMAGEEFTTVITVRQTPGGEDNYVEIWTTEDLLREFAAPSSGHDPGIPSVNPANRNIRLMADLDFGGLTAGALHGRGDNWVPLIWASPFTGGWTGVLDGNGFSITNFSARFFMAGDNWDGTIRNLHVQMTNNHLGALGGHLIRDDEFALFTFPGTIENSIFDITFQPYTAAAGARNDFAAVAPRSGFGATVRDSVFIIRGATRLAGDGLFRHPGAGAVIENVFIHTPDNLQPVSPNANVRTISAAQLNDATTFTDLCPSIWDIASGRPNGIAPRLRNTDDMDGGVTIDAPSASILEIGTTLQLTVQIEGVQQVTWSTSNANASVSPSGLVTGVAGGSVDITATHRSGASDFVSLTVLPQLEITGFSRALEMGGENATYQATLMASREHFEWESLDPTIATVDTVTGVITAVRRAGGEEATARIVARSTIDTSVYAQRVITVNPEIELTTNAPFDGSVNRYMLDFRPGFGGSFVVSVSRGGSENLGFSVTNNADALSSIEFDGYNLSVMASNAITSNTNVDISVYSLIDPDITIGIRVRVRSTAAITVLLSSDDETLFADAAVGDSVRLYAEVHNSTQDIVWSINPTGLASVDQNGLVEASPGASGTATVTATHTPTDGNPVTATATIRVQPAVISLEIRQGSNIRIPIGGEGVLLEGLANRGEFTWEISAGSSIVGLSSPNNQSTIRVTGLTSGTATVLIRSNRNTNITASITVAVASIQIIGTPTDGMAHSLIFSGLSVLDDADEPITNVTWSLRENSAGLSIDAATGRLTRLIDQTGTAIVRATVIGEPGIFDEFAITVLEFLGPPPEPVPPNAAMVTSWEEFVAAASISQNIYLATDITMPDDAPAWTSTVRFQHILEGNNRTIHNFRLAGVSENGLFRELGATNTAKNYSESGRIQNLSLMSPTVTTVAANINVGFIAGRIYGGRIGVIRNVHIIDATMNFVGRGNGGFIGRMVNRAELILDDSSISGTLNLSTYGHERGGVIGIGTDAPFVHSRGFELDITISGITGATNGAFAGLLAGDHAIINIDDLSATVNIEGMIGAGASNGGLFGNIENFSGTTATGAVSTVGFDDPRISDRSVRFNLNGTVDINTLNSTGFFTPALRGGIAGRIDHRVRGNISLTGSVRGTSPHPHSVMLRGNTDAWYSGGSRMTLDIAGLTWSP